jgi:metal-responsive CopG/Arc/MetJ family transcriptional regulator
MTKLNISMPQELLEEIDTEASVLGLTRSGLIQEASARYLVSARQNREAEVRRLRIEAAATRMRRIGIEFGPAVDTARLVAEARAAEEARHER